MIVRIGFVQTGKEIEVDLGDAKADDVTKDLAKQLDSDGAFVLADKGGKTVISHSSKIAYIEVGSDKAEHRIGFVG